MCILDAVKENNQHFSIAVFKDVKIREYLIIIDRKFMQLENNQNFSM